MFRMVALALVSALWIVTTVFSASTAYAGEEIDIWQNDQDRPAGPPAYEVEFSGVDRSLQRLLKGSSQLVRLQDHSPETGAGFDRRILDDIERFDTVMRSEGFFAAQFSYEINWIEQPPKVTIRVSPGPSYVLRDVDIILIGSAKQGAPRPPTAAEIGFELGRKTRAAEIVAAERRIVRFYGRLGRPLAEMRDRRVTVNHVAQTVDVRLEVDPGPQAAFGPVTIKGLKDIEEDYVRTLIPWSQGDPYDAGKLNILKARLLRAGAISAVVTEHNEKLNADGELPLTILIVEGPRRAIGAGVKYSTAEGIAAEASWEHRNVFGRNEDFKVTLEAGQITQKGKVGLRRPDFRLPGLDLLATSVLARVDSDAFQELGAEAAAGARMPLGGGWRAAADGSLEIARLDDGDGTRTSRLFGLPASLTYDGTDSRWRPTKGTRLKVSATPYIGSFEGDVSLLVNRVDGSAYLALDKDRRFVVAARASFGSIIGESLTNIPSNKRFYAGGDGSIRGYKFQRVGPLDEKGDPTGGRSLFLTGAELRVVTWRSISVVPFVEGGNVYEEKFPDFSRAPRWASGIGLRHHTVFGPVRLDFAFPINSREQVDDPFQFYVSIGQAF
jgi:translocation and assembly module TamA